MNPTAGPDPVKLFVAVLFSPGAPLERAKERLERFLGPIDYTSSEHPFDMTDYYREEMGEGLKRALWSFERLGPPDLLVGVKRKCVRIERSLAEGARRRVNLDAGYLEFEKVVLASTKRGGHKVYLGRGVYADIVLLYDRGKFKPFVWGFPDFKAGRYDRDLLAIRQRYRQQRRAGAGAISS